MLRQGRLDPRRQEMAYRQSAATLNLLRAFAQGGYSKLENVHEWMLDFVDDSPQSARYREVANSISEAISFMKAIGINDENNSKLRETAFLPATKRCCLVMRKH